MKTCPHCNGPGKLIWNILYCVACTKCGARTEWYDREEDAVRAWERRDGAEADKNTSVVPREAYEQVAWERDVAVKQLWDDYGVRLGQKKADAKLARTAWNRRAGEGADHGE